jgi:hypothetical protein
VPPERTFRRTCLPVPNEHRRRNAPAAPLLHHSPGHDHRDKKRARIRATPGLFAPNEEISVLIRLCGGAESCPTLGNINKLPRVRVISAPLNAKEDCFATRTCASVTSPTLTPTNWPHQNFLTAPTGFPCGVGGGFLKNRPWVHGVFCSPLAPHVAFLCRHIHAEKLGAQIRRPDTFAFIIQC